MMVRLILAAVFSASAIVIGLYHLVLGDPGASLATVTGLLLASAIVAPDLDDVPRDDD